MSGRKSILVVGVTHPSINAPDHIKQDGGNPTELHEKIQQMMAEAHAAGYDLTIRQLDPECLKDRTKDVEQLLQKQSWDGYLIGFGLRGDPSLTPYFEHLVNAGRLLRPETKLAFNTTPLDLVSTLERMFNPE